MRSWIKVAVFFLFLNATHCLDNEFRRHRIYRLRIPEGTLESFVKVLDIEEAKSQFDVLRSHRDYADVMVGPTALREFKKLIKTYNASAEVIENDVERLIKRFKRANTRALGRSRLRRSTENFLLHDAYLPFHEMEANLRAIAKNFDFTSLEELGRTEESRSIWLLKISINKSLPIIWIDAGIHAREWIAPASAFYLIDMLLSREGGKMLQKYQFYIAPQINPDGYEYSFKRNRYWRKNRSKTPHSECYGVDLNRNFPLKWGLVGSSSNPCADIFRGLSAADQEETKSVVKKLTAIANQTKLFLSLHSYGQLFLIPYGYQRSLYPPHYPEMQSMAMKIIYKIWREYGDVYSTGSAADLLYAASGGSDDYAYSILNIPYTYTIELPDLGTYNFLLPPAYITLVGREMWTALQIYVEHMK